jgi:predicted transcriptional regulator
MNSLKTASLQIIERLPDNATWDDLMHRLYSRQKIEAGIQAAHEGRVIAHEEVKRRFSSL